MKNTSMLTTVYERPGPVSDMFVPHKAVISLPIQRRTYRSPIVVTALLAIIAVPALMSSGWTGAYFSDHEQSTGNTFAAGPLDFTVSALPPGATLMLGKTGQTFVLTVAPAAGSLPFRYKVSATATGDPTFCAAITALGSVPLAYAGSAASLTTGDTDDLTPWSLILSLPSPATGVVDGLLCNLDLTYQGYQEGGIAGTEYHDTEHVILNLISDPPAIVPQSIPELETIFVPEPDESAAETSGETVETVQANEGTTTEEVQTESNTPIESVPPIDEIITLPTDQSTETDPKDTSQADTPQDSSTQ